MLHIGNYVCTGIIHVDLHNHAINWQQIVPVEWTNNLFIHYYRNSISLYLPIFVLSLTFTSVSLVLQNYDTDLFDCV